MALSTLLLLSATQPRLAAATESAGQELVVLTWNVENLFDAEDDPDNPGDDAYTPQGWTRWTEARYRHKLTNLAEVVSELVPDIFCLVEVENRRVLEDLANLLRVKHSFDLPFITHRDCGDLRGIDTAIMSKFEPTNVVWLKPLAVQRDIIVADFSVNGKPLAIILNHWKSHFGKKAESDAIRELEARTVRAEVERRLQEDKAAAIIVTGDFNDNVESVIPLIHGGFSLDYDAVLQDGRLLYNLSAELPHNQRGTYYYHRDKRWNSFDMFAISRGLLTNGVPASAWQINPATFSIHAPEKLRQEDGSPYPFRRLRTREGVKIFSGYSDHFPIVVTVSERESEE